MDFKKDFKNLLDLYDLFELWVKYKSITKTKRRRKNRLNNKTRNEEGYYKVTFLKIKETDSAEFFNHTRMTPSVFDCLLALIRHQLTKTSIRKPINPECRLALTLLYLSQGVTFQSLALSWKLGKETVRAIIYETCDAIWNCLSIDYVSEPNLVELQKIENNFNTMWNLPNCIGAIGGKHIALQRPPHSGSDFFNYENFYSIVLMAACDAHYTFTYVDVGEYGSQSDGGIFQLSSFGKRILGNRLDVPPAKYLPNSQHSLPHFFVADTAFPLHVNIMKPFPGVNLSKEKEYYNKRISRATKIIENSFGILAARWRILLTTLSLLPKNAKKIILACIALHNFLRLNEESKNVYVPPQYVDWIDEDNNVHKGLWRNEIYKNLTPIAPSQSKHTYQRSTSTNIKSELCSYFNNEGYIHFCST